MTDSNRTVLITGAAQGLGRAMSAGLLERGFNIAAVDRDANGLSALREQVGAGPNFEGFVADLTDFDAAKLAAEVEQRFGRIDILINNAGIGLGEVRLDYHAHPPKFYEVTPGQWSRAIAVNANAVFFLSRAVVKPMIERKWGRIINITTSLGTMLHCGSTPDGPSKASAGGVGWGRALDPGGGALCPRGVAATPNNAAAAAVARLARGRPRPREAVPGHELGC